MRRMLDSADIKKALPQITEHWIEVNTAQIPETEREDYYCNLFEDGEYTVYITIKPGDILNLTLQTHTNVVITTKAFNDNYWDSNNYLDETVSSPEESYAYCVFDNTDSNSAKNFMIRVIVMNGLMFMVL